MLYSYWCNNKDARWKTSLTKYLPPTLLQGFERVVQGLRVRGSWRSNITPIFWPPKLWPATLCLSRSSDAQPEPWGPLCWVLAFFTASYQHLLWTPIHQGFPRAPSAGCGFPYHISSPTPSDLQLAVGLNWQLPRRTQLPTQLARRTQLRYIIIRRPLDLWNRMFNRHQAEITVMQFRGHSLPVCQSMRVSWDFLACPILLANFRPHDFLS